MERAFELFSLLFRTQTLKAPIIVLIYALRNCIFLFHFDYYNRYTFIYLNYNTVNRGNKYFISLYIYIYY
jgi:hypothetical protein